MPTCGHCGKPVAASDVTCPHCNVLLAAYASPIGSGAAATYEAPPEPPSAVIPDVDMEVKPPSEADIVTDPTEVAEEPISTAPRPLFDTYLTVEEIARAAESDHEDDVVTISEAKIATKKVEFDVPDYARPPANAEPIPTIDEDDASVPLITQSMPVTRAAPVEKREEDEESEPEPEPDSASESWLYSHSTSSAEAPPRPRTTSQRMTEHEPDTVLDRLLEPNPTSHPETRELEPREPESISGPPGQTDAYLRRLHQEAGYTPSESTISQPVERRRISPAERNRNRRSALSVDVSRQQEAQAQSMRMGCSALYMIGLVLMWLIVVVTMASGNFNPALIFFAIALSWGRKPIGRLIEQVSSQ